MCVTIWATKMTFLWSQCLEEYKKAISNECIMPCNHAFALRQGVTSRSHVCTIDSSCSLSANFTVYFYYHRLTHFYRSNVPVQLISAPAPIVNVVNSSNETFQINCHFWSIYIMYNICTEKYYILHDIMFLKLLFSRYITLFCFCFNL